jgi:hypothetical protein
MNYVGKGQGGHAGQGQGGGMNYGGLGGGVNGAQGGGMNYGGQGGLGANFGVIDGSGQVGFGANVGGMGGGPNFGGPSAAGAMITPEIMMATIQATKAKTKAPGDTTIMICYYCGQVGRHSNDCQNPKNFALVMQIIMAQGRKPCDQCGKFGHPPHLCWNISNNANTRPDYWRRPITPRPVAPMQPMPSASM